MKEEVCYDLSCCGRRSFGVWLVFSLLVWPNLYGFKDGVGSKEEQLVFDLGVQARDKPI